jgi:hypothetical protein
MPPYSDVYVLAPGRSAAVIARFLERFAPMSEEVVDEYEVPRFAASPSYQFRRAAELVEHLAAHPYEPHGIYWRNLGAGPAFAMAFFTTDGAILLGLSCVEGEAEAWLKELRTFAGAESGCIMFEQPPPDSADEFGRMIATRARAEDKT